ncbi:LacI family transcriptional regulator [Burkholderia sp. WAC0059]|nr:LacI family transcriptional regulator [Burkholderia sp. WAC0059]
MRLARRQGGVARRPARYSRRRAGAARAPRDDGAGWTLTTEGKATREGKKRAPRRKSNAVSVMDVARAAGVSTATVSRVLNGHSTVAPDLQARVKEIAEALGYTPHAAARALASQRSKTIGAVIPSLENQNFALGVFALQKRIGEAGYTLLLACSYYDQEDELRQVRALIADGIAGLMLVGRSHTPALYELLEKEQVPFVNGWTVDHAHPYVGFDNVAVGRRLAEYLLDLGHVHFAMITQMTQHSDRAADRIVGVRAALQSRGLELRHEHVIEMPHRIIEGQMAMKALMQGPVRPTAIICGTDLLAIGALAEAREAGIDVPGELSIAGINDVEFSSFTTPPLTTMRLAADEIGARSADYLLARIEGRPISSQNIVPTDLIVRGTTGRPQGK